MNGDMHLESVINDFKSMSSLGDTLTIGSASENESANSNSGFASASSSISIGTSTASVLQPIDIRDARTRSYLVGSVGCQDSLMGCDELMRYFPNGKMKVFVVTWNMSSRTAPHDLNDLLLPECISHVPDMYAIGIQESYSSDIREWQIALQTTIGPSHVLLHSCSLGVLHLTIFLRRDLVWFCTAPEECTFNSRSAATNVVKTKGALAISFAFFGTTFLFINSHLKAHENKIKDRIDEYERICNSLELPKNLRPLNPKYISGDVTARFDCVFWFGDLNFRIERTGNDVIDIINEMQSDSNPSINRLLQHDQLNKIMIKNLAFYGFSEAANIRFPPTYKFKIGSDDYDTNKQRVPSYTDRILFRSKRISHINCLCYDWAPHINTSDHKPVFALMEVFIRPGRDYASRLNAGMFNRDVYIDALKKRAREGEDDLRTSLVCSVM